MNWNQIEYLYNISLYKYPFLFINFIKLTIYDIQIISKLNFKFLHP